MAMWGESPITVHDVFEVFARYVEGKIPILPWCEAALQPETVAISESLAAINRYGFLTINSQPAVNGEKSEHPVYGWGGSGGRVYQKAYVEFFASPSLLESTIEVLKKHHNHLSYYAVNAQKQELSSGKKTVTALTWGVFPDKEVMQPTIFDPEIFTVWSHEAFTLWTKSWASLYDDETDSCALLYDVSLFCSNRFLFYMEYGAVIILLNVFSILFDTLLRSMTHITLWP